jgi:hypothetical protein
MFRRRELRSKKLSLELLQLQAENHILALQLLEAVGIHGTFPLLGELRRKIRTNAPAVYL